MPRDIHLKPIICKALDTVNAFRDQYNVHSEEVETIDEIYREFVDEIDPHLNDFQEYQKRLTGEISKNIDTDAIEEVISSIFEAEEPNQLNERSDRVREVQNALFWDNISHLVGYLEKLSGEVDKYKVDETDTDSSTGGY